jgi:hypothetical protein
VTFCAVTGKTAYQTHADARKARRALAKRPKHDNVEVYKKCRACGLFHLGRRRLTKAEKRSGPRAPSPVTGADRS